MGRADAKAMLQSAGLRCTNGRMALLSALLAARRTLAHDEVCARVREQGLDRVTVYRALESFVKAGIVHRIESGSRWRFAVCGRVHRGHCHPHFTCRVCGTVECLRDVALPRLRQGFGGRARLGQLRGSYRVEEQEFYLRGVCGRCAAGGAGA